MPMGYGNGVPMASIIEKQDGTIVVLIHLSLKPDRDDAIIHLIQSAPKRGLAGIVREVIRMGIGENRNQKMNDPEVQFEIPNVGIDL